MLRNTLIIEVVICVSIKLNNKKLYVFIHHFELEWNT